ncbi:MAG: hypothetical protein ACE5IA_05275, partial [Dehalococcoidia bacterium]
IIGAGLLLIALPSRLIAAIPPPAPVQPYVPSLEQGEPLEGTSEAHLYDIEMSSKGLRTNMDASIAESLVNSLALRQLARMEEQGGLPGRIESPQLDLKENNILISGRMATKDFQAQDAQPIRGNVSVAIQDVEVLQGGYRAHLELSFGEDVANSLIEGQLPRISERAQFPLSLESLRVAFQEDMLSVVGRLDAGSLTIDIGARARVGVEAGRPKIAIEELVLGRLSLPSPLVKQVNPMIEQATASITMQNLPLQLQEITLREGRMHLRALVTLTKKGEGR